MNNYAMLAEAFRYPVQGRLETLSGFLPEIDGEARQGFVAFVNAIQKLSLADWKELYVGTWDLNPIVAPYIGFHVWGQGYQRSAFMARLQYFLMKDNIDPDGELPDHMIPVLRYLAKEPEPYPELLKVLPLALERITTILRNADSANPYLSLTEGLLAYHKVRKMTKKNERLPVHHPL